MEKVYVLTGKPAVVVVVCIALLAIVILGDQVRIHYNSDARNWLNRDSIITVIGPWLHAKVQKNESTSDWVRRKVTELEQGKLFGYRATIGDIEVRGFGKKVVAAVQIYDDSNGTIRYFTLQWLDYKKAWQCSYDFDYGGAGSSGIIHPETDGFGLVGRWFLRARLPGNTKYEYKGAQKPEK